MYTKDAASPKQIMSNTNDHKKDLDTNLIQPIDLYYECITSCSIDNKGIDCLTECVATYYQEVVESC